MKWKAHIAPLLTGILLGAYVMGGLTYFEVGPGLPGRLLLGAWAGALGAGASWLGGQTRLGTWARMALVPLGAALLGILGAWALAMALHPDLGEPGSVLQCMALLAVLPLAVYLLSLLEQALPAAQPAEASSGTATGNAMAASADAAADAPAPAILRLSASQAGQETELVLDHLTHVEAADNYCKFHLAEPAGPRVLTLRIKMKEVEELLGQAPGFFRVHRSYLVHARHVEAVTGNSQAYRLRLREGLALVPVSRSFDLEELRPFLPV